MAGWACSFSHPSLHPLRAVGQVGFASVASGFFLCGECFESNKRDVGPGRLSLPDRCLRIETDLNDEVDKHVSDHFQDLVPLFRLLKKKFAVVMPELIAKLDSGGHGWIKFWNPQAGRYARFGLRSIRTHQRPTRCKASQSNRPYSCHMVDRLRIFSKHGIRNEAGGAGSQSMV